MKLTFDKNFFNINSLTFIVFNFFLIAIFKGPLFVNIFYILLLAVFIYKVRTKEINFEVNFNLSLIFQIIFCFYIILNSLTLNEETSLTYKSLFYFRFFLAAYIISKILNSRDYTISSISLIFLLCSILLSLDIIYQFQTGRDIFGFQAGLCQYPQGSAKIIPSLCERFSGFFGSEFIAGGFLSTYGLFFTYLYFDKIKKNFFTISLISLILILLLSAIIISGERNAILGLLPIFFFNLIFNKKLRKNLIIVSITFVLIFTFSFNNIKNVKYRYFDWPVNYVSKQEGTLFKKLLQTPWGAHYITSHEIFLDNKLFGSGYKSFRIECKKTEYAYENLNKIYDIKLKDTGCSSHPHNMYLEILSELGIVGFIIFFFVIYFILLHPYIKNSKYFKEKETVIFVLSIIITILFPFRPTGSFTATIFSTNIWFFIGFYLYFVNRVVKKK